MISIWFAKNIGNVTKYWKIVDEIFGTCAPSITNFHRFVVDRYSQCVNVIVPPIKIHEYMAIVD